jgi:hypothetical protein
MGPAASETNPIALRLAHPVHTRRHEAYRSSAGQQRRKESGLHH